MGTLLAAKIYRLDRTRDRAGWRDPGDAVALDAQVGYGLTPVTLASYFVASWIAMLPGTLAYVYFGSALGDVTGSATALQKTIKISLAVAAVVATIFIARIAARAIRSAGVEEAKAAPTPDKA